MSYNPSTPSTFGLEWLVKESPAVNAQSSAPIAVKFASSATETIDTVAWYFSAFGGTTKPVVCDVYELDDAVIGSVSTATYRPNADGAVKSNVQNQAASTTNIYQAVDEATVSTADYISGDGSGTPIEWTFQVGSAAFAGRPKQVAVKFDAQAVAGTFTLTPYVRIGSTDYLGTPTTIGGAEGVVTYVWSLNPATNLPWTQAEVASFDTATIEFGFKWSANSTNYRLYQTWIEVQYVTENRVATGSLTTPALGWNTFSLATPAGVDNWAKVNGTNYLVVLSVPSGTGNPFVHPPRLDTTDGGVCPHASYQGYSPTADSGWSAITTLGSVTTKVPGLVLTTTAPAVSTDSQAYAQSVEASVSAGTTVQQEFTPGSNATITQLRVKVKRAGTPSGDLLAKIRRRSDNVQIGGTATISTADFAGSADYVTVAKAFASSAAVVSGTQYYLELSSTSSTGATDNYRIRYLDSKSGTADTVGFGGTTDRLTVGSSPGTESDDTDLPFTVATQPTTPTNFGGVTDPNQGSCHPVAKLAWDETALVGNFDRYELDRLDRDGTTWHRIAEITDETMNEFFDGDGRRAVAESYRVRVRRTDQAVSDWSATVQVTADHPNACDCDVILTSNDDLTLSVCGIPDGPRVYRFPKDSAVLELYDTDYTVAFTELEQRGDDFSYTLTLYTEGTTPPRAAPDPGRRAFDTVEALRDAQADDVRAVTVLDPEGNRWYTHMTITDGTHAEPGGFHSVNVTFRELTRTPPVVTLP